MLGGTYLCYEGAEKVYEKLAGHHGPEETPQEQFGPEHEGPMVAGAIRTDFILSAEIMVIALNEVADEPFVSRAVILLVVAVAITILVYGVVAADREDGRRRPPPHRAVLASSPSGSGTRMVRAMPGLLTVISVVGTAAMLWVGGHIILVGVDDLGWHWPYDLVHHWEEDVEHAVGGIGAAVAWLVNTVASLVIGVVWGVRGGGRDARAAVPQEGRRGATESAGGRRASRILRIAICPALSADRARGPPDSRKDRSHGLQGRRPLPGRLRPHRDQARRARDARPDGDAGALRQRASRSPAPASRARCT